MSLEVSNGVAQKRTTQQNKALGISEGSKNSDRKKAPQQGEGKVILEVSKSFDHKRSSQQKKHYGEQELKQIMLDLLNENGVAIREELKGNNTFQLADAQQLKLHKLMLKAEEIGLDIKLTRKTLIEIS